MDFFREGLPLRLPLWRRLAWRPQPYARPNIQSRGRDRAHQSDRSSARSRHRNYSPTIAERRLGAGINQLTCEPILRNARAVSRNAQSFHGLGADRAIDVDAVAAIGPDDDVTRCSAANTPERRPPSARGTRRVAFSHRGALIAYSFWLQAAFVDHRSPFTYVLAPNSRVLGRSKH